jgi:diguanylate cyclase (GGDEF)-like protein
MKRSVAWVGRALAVLGLAAVVPGVLHASLWALCAALGGFVAATGLALAPLVRVWLAERPLARPSDFTHMVDLVRRAHGGRAAWAVGLPDDDVLAVGEDEVGHDVSGRGSGIVQLASVDGRAHVEHTAEGTYVAVGDFPYGAGVLLAQGDAQRDAVETVATELRRVVAGMRLAQVPERGEPAQLVGKQLAAITGGAQTLEGVAKAGVELAQQFTQRGAAVVLQGTGRLQTIQVVAASTRADKRLAGLAVPDGAPAARAIHAGVAVVSHGEEDVFGAALADRRRRDRAGTAYPLMDGHFAIGALVIAGPPVESGTPLADQLARLVQELGSRLAAARAVHEAEQRAVVDPLTGLRNRRGFERQLSRYQDMDGSSHVSLIYIDLDRFKLLNDTLGHAAGDAALRHVAGILQSAVREHDVAARIGGEEFAVWMPNTPFAEGIEVAERIRRAVETMVWYWNGVPYPVTASCGVASYPDSVGDVNNLRGAADAALYRAKQAGRNRVEKALAAG